MSKDVALELRKLSARVKLLERNTSELEARLVFTGALAEAAVSLLNQSDFVKSAESKLGATMRAIRQRIPADELPPYEDAAIHFLSIIDSLRTESAASE